MGPTARFMSINSGSDFPTEISTFEKKFEFFYFEFFDLKKNVCVHFETGMGW